MTKLIVAFQAFEKMPKKERKHKTLVSENRTQPSVAENILTYQKN